MKNIGQSKESRSITVRIAILAWSVSLITFALFVFAIIPEQQLDLWKALEEKSLGLAASVGKVAGSNIGMDDFKPVVDHCRQTLAADSAADQETVPAACRREKFGSIVTSGEWPGAIWIMRGFGQDRKLAGG